MTDTPKPVVLAPDIFLRALHHSKEYRVLLLWRDGNILPIVTRPLLVEYLRLFRKVGLEENTLKKWVLWLTSHEKVRYIEEVSGKSGIREVLMEAASAGEAEVVVSSILVDFEKKGPVLLPQSLLESFD